MPRYLISFDAGAMTFPAAELPAVAAAAHTVVQEAKDASVWVSASDLFLRTNYSGLDPIVNGNTAAVGGSGASGIDFGNFPMPKGINMGLKIGY